MTGQMEELVTQLIDGLNEALGDNGHAQIATAKLRPTELGAMMTMTAPGAIVTAEFDVEKPPELILTMLKMAPNVLIDLANRVESDDEDDKEPDG